MSASPPDASPTDDAAPPSGRSRDREPLKNLSLLALFISTDVQKAMAAAYVTHAAEAFFHLGGRAERGQRYRIHPSASLTYAALEALEDRALVTVAEHLRDHHGLHPLGDVANKIRRFQDIYLHRHALSHPARVEWDDPKMIEFADKDRPAYDWRPPLLWDLQKSINEVLSAAGEKIYVDTGPEAIRRIVSGEMAISLHVILETIRTVDYSPPTIEQLAWYLTNEAGKFQAALEKHADGQVRPDKNARISALRRAAYDDATYMSADAVRCSDVLELLDHLDWLHAIRKEDEAVAVLRELEKSVPEILPRPHRFSRSAKLNWSEQRHKDSLRVPLQVDDVKQWKRLIELAVPMFFGDLVHVLAKSKA